MSGLERIFKFTEVQMAARVLLCSVAMHIMLFGGSRSGKTFIICRQIVVRALKAPGSRHAILRFRFNHVKTAIWHDTFPKMMKLCFPGVRYREDKSDWYIEFENGSQIWFGGLDDKQRTEKVLGQEYATIFLNECSQISYAAREIILTRLAQDIGLVLKCFYDENPPFKTHWTHKLFIDKRELEPPHKPLAYPEDYVSMRMNPKDNEENLPPNYIKKVLGSLTARGKTRFLDGLFGSGDENALWEYDVIQRHRVSKVPDLQRIIIAVDPSGTKGEETGRSDHVGIVVVGLGVDGHAYVLEDATAKVKPSLWGKIVCSCYERHGADLVVGEVNYGGAMVESVIKAAALDMEITVFYKEVRATRGKVVRAEPFSGLYDQGKVHHVGGFTELEDQLCAFTTHGYMGDRSPDRVDALVWALTELFPDLLMGNHTNTQTEVDMTGYNPLETFEQVGIRQESYARSGRGRHHAVPDNSQTDVDMQGSNSLDWDA